jgi:hypothetical protein
MKDLKLFLRRLLKTQFFEKHKWLFIYIPILFSLIFWYINIWIWNIEKIIPNIVTIIWITWGVLLNFLVIILTSHSTVLNKIKDKKWKEYEYWEINIGTKKHPENKPINFYYLVYYKTFFLIFLSVFFILLYIFSFLWLSILVWMMDQWIVHILDYCKFSLSFLDTLLNYWIIKYILISWYLYLIILYFTLFTHLIYKLYYLFHSDEEIN